MKKSLQYVIALSCLVIAGSVAYYFISYIPERNLQSLQKDCYKMAMDRAAEDKKIASPEGSLPTEPQYTFDDKTKRCLYKTISLLTTKSNEGTGLSSVYSIVDLQRNVEVAGYSSVSGKDGEQIMSGDKYGYIKLDKELFLK